MRHPKKSNTTARATQGHLDIVLCFCLPLMTSFSPSLCGNIWTSPLQQWATLKKTVKRKLEKREKKKQYKNATNWPTRPNQYYFERQNKWNEINKRWEIIRNEQWEMGEEEKQYMLNIAARAMPIFSKCKRATK